MKSIFLAIALAAAPAAVALGSAAAYAHETEEVDTVFERAIPNIPGKSGELRAVGTLTFKRL